MGNLLGSSASNAEFAEWREGKTQKQINMYMMTHRIDCDVIFLVGPEKEEIYAHKFILEAQSCVFENMLKGPTRSPRQIVLADTDPAAFKEILRFLYSDEVDITSDNVRAILELSSHYVMHNLSKQCFVFLDSKLSVATACNTMEMGHKYERNALWEDALDFIERHPTEVLQTKSSVGDLCHDCFHHIISVAEIDVHEWIIFEAAVAWATSECRKKGKEVNPTALREVLGATLYEIRFPLMSPEYFVKSVEPSGLLTDKEQAGVLEKMLQPKSDSFPFVAEPRVGKIRVRSVIRFRHHGEEWKYDWSFDDAMAFKCDHRIKLLGLILYGPNALKKAKYTIKVSVYDAHIKHLDGSQFTTSVEAYRDDVTYHVKFPTVLQLDRDVVYTITANISGPTSFKGTDGRTHVEADGASFNFVDTKMSKNHTTTLSGQIAGVVFRLSSFKQFMS